MRAQLSLSARTRLVEKIFHTLRYEPSSRCWLAAGRVHGGSVQVRYGETSSRISMHLVIWLTHRGELPVGKWPDVKCQNERCVNPDHLFLKATTPCPT